MTMMRSRTPIATMQAVRAYPYNQYVNFNFELFDWSVLERSCFFNNECGALRCECKKEHQGTTKGGGVYETFELIINLMFNSMIIPLDEDL